MILENTFELGKRQFLERSLAIKYNQSYYIIMMIDNIKQFAFIKKIVKWKKKMYLCFILVRLVNISIIVINPIIITIAIGIVRVNKTINKLRKSGS